MQAAKALGHKVSRGGAPRRRIAALLAAAVLAVLALMLHLAQDKPSGGNPASRTVSAPVPENLQARLPGLLAHLAKHPTDVRALATLARVHAALGRFAEAGATYARLTALVPDNGQFWAEYAEAVAMTSGKKLQGRPLDLVNKALQLDPDNQSALALAGRADFDAGNIAGAIDHWEHLLRLLPQGSPEHRATAASLVKARKALQRPNTPSPPRPSP